MIQRAAQVAEMPPTAAIKVNSFLFVIWEGKLENGLTRLLVTDLGIWLIGATASDREDDPVDILAEVAWLVVGGIIIRLGASVLLLYRRSSDAYPSEILPGDSLDYSVGETRDLS